jgi:hypothetical protein
MMADKRMISLQILNSAKFLKMPISAQALYAHLVVRADDDGVVESYGVLRLVGANEDDLKILAAKGYVVILNEDYVTYINNWTDFNILRSDRSKDSIYQQLLVSVLPDVPVLVKKERSDRSMKNKINGTSHGLPMDGIGQVRLGQVRLRQQQDSIVVAIDQIGNVDTETDNGEKINHQKNLLLLLSKIGCKDQQALDLIRAYGIETVQVQLKVLAHQDNIRNPVGWLLAALRDGYVDSMTAVETEKMQRKIENERLRQSQLAAVESAADVPMVNNFLDEYQKYKKLGG